MAVVWTRAEIWITVRKGMQSVVAVLLVGLKDVLKNGSLAQPVVWLMGIVDMGERERKIWQMMSRVPWGDWKRWLRTSKIETR